MLITCKFFFAVGENYILYIIFETIIKNKRRIFYIMLTTPDQSQHSEGTLLHEYEFSK